MAYSYSFFFLPSLLSPSCRLPFGLLGSRGSRRLWAQRFPGPQQVLCCPVGWLGGFGLRWVSSPRFPAPACHFLMEPCPWWKGCRPLWSLCRDPWAFLPLHGGAGWPPPLCVCACVIAPDPRRLTPQRIFLTVSGVLISQQNSCLMSVHLVDLQGERVVSGLVSMSRHGQIIFPGGRSWWTQEGRRAYGGKVLELLRRTHRLLGAGHFVS